MLCRKASSTLAPPSGRAPATRTRLLATGSELGGSVWRFLTRRVAVAYAQTYTANFYSGSQHFTS